MGKCPVRCKFSTFGNLGQPYGLFNWRYFILLMDVHIVHYYTSGTLPVGSTCNLIIYTLMKLNVCMYLGYQRLFSVHKLLPKMVFLISPSPLQFRDLLKCHLMCLKMNQCKFQRCFISAASIHFCNNHCILGDVHILRYQRLTNSLDPQPPSYLVTSLSAYVVNIIFWLTPSPLS